MSDSPLNDALRHFEAAEANLVRAEKTLAAIEAAIPSGVAFGRNPEYENHCRTFDSLFAALPMIDGWRPSIRLLDLEDIAQNRLDAQEVYEIESIVAVERQIEEPSRLLQEYRFRFTQKRRELVRGTLIELIDAIDANLRNLSTLLKDDSAQNHAITDDNFDSLKDNIAQIATLIGSSVAKPARWSDLHRHMRSSSPGCTRSTAL